MSNITLTRQKTSILLLAPSYSTDFSEHLGMIVSNEGSQAFFSPFGFPIHGFYDDYGHIDGIDRNSRSVRLLEDYFGVDIEEILNNIGDDRDIPENIKHIDVFKKLAKTYFRTEVLEHLESGWEKTNLTNPSKYSWDGRLKGLLEQMEKNEKSDIAELKAKPMDTLTTDERKRLIYHEIDSIDPVIERMTYLSNHASVNMFKELKITTEFKEEILKQARFLSNIGYGGIRKLLMPSLYGSQEDTWKQTYLFNSFVNDLLVDDMKEKIEDSKRWGDDDDYLKSEKSIVQDHQSLVRDRKINSIMDF